MEVKLNVRVDERTQAEIGALVEHFNAASEALGKVTASDVARLAIHRLHESTLAQKTAA
jgi:hypothetical protein